MKYLVMECHVGYAVVLDEEGRFLKVANLNYQVGQTVTNVIQETIPMEKVENKITDTSKIRRINRWMKPLVPVAAAFCFLIIMAWQMMFVPYGSVEMVINPDVLLQVNRMDKVIDVEGLNQDGMDLVEAYEYKGKTVDLVSDELADRAVEMGYLTEGGTIHLIINGKKEEWKVATEERLLIELEVHMGETYVIQVDPSREAVDDTPTAGDSDDRDDDWNDDDRDDDDWDDDDRDDRDGDDRDDDDQDDADDNDDGDDRDDADEQDDDDDDNDVDDTDDDDDRDDD